MADLEAALPTEETPLVVPQNEDDLEKGVEPNRLKAVKEGSILEIIIGVFAAITFIFSALAILLYHGIFVVISGLLGVFLSPFAAFQQMKMTQSIAMKETNTFFENQLDILKESNKNLSLRIQDLTETVRSLQKMEVTLGYCKTLQGNCLQQLEEQLKQGKEIKYRLKTSVKDDLVDAIFEIALRCDDDGDMKLSDEEMHNMVNRLEGLHGVQVREQKLRQLVANDGRNVFSLMTIAKNMLQDDIPEEDKLFGLQQVGTQKSSASASL